MNFSNISLVQNKILCNTSVLFIFCVYLLFRIFSSVCTFYAFRHESILIRFFCFALFFCCASLTGFVTSLLFLLLFFNFYVLLKIF